MDLCQQTLESLRHLAPAAPQKLALVGLDGFVDTIVTPVATRSGQGENFSPIRTIEEFGRRMLAAAGKSTNLELYPRMDKLGGNGPIMANALLAHGTRLRYIGALGRHALHPVFHDLAARADIISLCDPAVTTAVEFEDGKIMLGQMRSFDELTYERILEKTGETGLRDFFNAADVIALVNWTMIPGMTAIFRRLLADILPTLAHRDRIFFFDLADPEKRSRDDLLEALDVIAQFNAFGSVTLGLNLKEAQQVHRALGFFAVGEDESGLRQIAREIRAKLGVATVVVHPRASATCATAEGDWWLPGPYVTRPLITTGAGDHFNAGFVTGQLLGLPPASCLVTGVSTSGHYVRTATSPTLDDLQTFLANWN